MADWVWILLGLVLLAAVAIIAFRLGQQMALNNASGARDEREPQSEASRGRQAPRPSGPPPPAMAGGRSTAHDASTEAPARRASPPPAAAAGSPSGSYASTSAKTPKRTAAPPPAQAAWSSDTPKKPKS